MTFNNVEVARPVVWLIPEGFVEHKGDEYRFWYEYDARDNEVNYEFIDDEPPESFDYEEFERYCQEQVKQVR